MLKFLFCPEQFLVDLTTVRVFCSRHQAPLLRQSPDVVNGLQYASGVALLAIQAIRSGEEVEPWATVAETLTIAADFVADLAAITEEADALVVLGDLGKSLKGLALRATTMDSAQTAIESALDDLDAAEDGEEGDAAPPLHIGRTVFAGGLSD